MCNLILIPLYGIIGAAIATSVARTVLNFGLAFQIYYTMGIVTIYNPFSDIRVMLKRGKKRKNRADINQIDENE